MLTDLRIRNFAIIDELHISFQGGLNILSGETGAGKSIIIGAIGLLLGERATADLIRSSEDSAVVEAVFDIHGRRDLKAKLEEMGFPAEEELVIRRIVSRSGKNRVFVGGAAATLGALSSLSESLVNICGQHEHQVLLNSDRHIDILDEFGGLLPSRAEYARTFEACQSLKARLRELEVLQQKRTEREDFLRFQLREILDAGPRPGEDAALADERRILQHTEKLLECSRAAYDGLYGRDGSILAETRRLIGSIREIRKIDAEFRIDPGDLDPLAIQLEDVALALRDYTKKLPRDPARLNEVEERLETINRLKRKHGGSLESVLKAKESLEGQLESLESAAGEMERIGREIDNAESHLTEWAETLSRARVKIASVLETSVNAEIRSLRMEQARFKVIFGKPAEGPPGERLHAGGIDRLEFYLSTNVGEELKPLNRIASGGELSRIVLAMKKVLARTGSVGTVIFDEVDSGIGGATAEVVGRKLKDVSEHHQVLCITHLPQIACFGDSHYQVVKRVSGDRTMAGVRALDEKERLDEVARMLGGVKVTDKTREHAREMLKAARK